MKRFIAPGVALALALLAVPPVLSESYVLLGELPEAGFNGKKVLKIDIDSIREFKGWIFATLRRDDRWTDRKHEPWEIKVHCRKKYYQRGSSLKNVRRNGIWVVEALDTTTHQQRVDNIVKHFDKARLSEEKESWSKFYRGRDKFQDNVFNFLCKGEMPTSFYP